MASPFKPAPEPGLSTPPSNPGLRQLIRAKAQFSYEPDARARSLGFRGWHERGYLPHFDAPNVTQLITFNLVDAFPVKRRSEWGSLFRNQSTSESRRQLEAWLDRGLGECWLRKTEVASVVESTLLSGHQNEYELRAWVIMPNHIHIVVDVWEKPLENLIKYWKGSSASAANRVLSRHGQFWQKEYWDTLIKDEKHFAKAVRYVENNPTKAKLVLDPKDWRWSSARRKNAYGELAD
jgi:REP element-mobilizing transposase RayT